MSYNAEIQSNNADLQTILDKVNALPEAGSGEAAEPVIEALEVTANGTYEAPSGTDGYNPVVVNVPVPDGYIQPSGSVTITKNGTHDVTEYASAEVNVPSEEPVLQEKTAAPSTAEQTVTPDDGYDGLSKVTIEAMPTAAQATPIITVSSSGLITAKANQAAGYVSAGSKSATKQLTTKGATTITPTDTEQTAVPAGTYVTGDIKVAAVEDSGGITPSGTMTITANGTYDVTEYASAVVNVPTEGGGGSSGNFKACAVMDVETFDPVPVYFEDGWTWGDFVNSALNKRVASTDVGVAVFEALLDENACFTSDHTVAPGVYYEDEYGMTMTEPVRLTDLIIEGYYYEFAASDFDTDIPET